MRLKPQELSLLQEVGFGPAVGDVIRKATRNRLERVLVQHDYRKPPEPGPGVSIAVKNGEEAEPIMAAIQADLVQRGYRAFWSNRREPNGRRTTDEVVILRTTDPFDMVRLQRTIAGERNISTDDIIARLTEWQRICEFAVVGAGGDWVALQFSRLPERICAFAEEVYTFCPDTVEQGVGLKRERDDPDAFRAARELCPDIRPDIGGTKEQRLAPMDALPPEMASRFRELYDKLAEQSTPTEMGVRLLAYELSTKKYVFLWWD